MNCYIPILSYFPVATRMMFLGGSRILEAIRRGQCRPWVECKTSIDISPCGKISVTLWT